jgi:hypothetical protein
MNVEEALMQSDNNLSEGLIASILKFGTIGVLAVTGIVLGTLSLALLVATPVLPDEVITGILSLGSFWMARKKLAAGGE